MIEICINDINDMIMKMHNSAFLMKYVFFFGNKLKKMLQENQ